MQKFISELIPVMFATAASVLAGGVAQVAGQRLVNAMFGPNEKVSCEVDVRFLEDENEQNKVEENKVES